MAKDAFDMLVETVNESNKVLSKLASQVSAHAVWIKIFSTLLIGMLAGLIKLWISHV